jgi:hypothetical protein
MLLAKKKAAGAALFFMDLEVRKRLNSFPRPKKENRGLQLGENSVQPPVSICRISAESSAAVVAVLARGEEPLFPQIRSGPAPRHHPL